jgi:tetratricopeptide (TPR) repeat protein
MKYPIRHENHILEKESRLALEQAIPREWILNQFSVDYGTDFSCEIAKENKVIGTNFSIQLKAKATEVNKDFVIIKDIKRSTINRWAKRLEPTMIVAYIDDEKLICWQWIEKNTFDLSKDNNTFQIKISKRNSFTNIDWNIIYNYVETIFERKYLLYQIPEKSNKYDEAWRLYFNSDYENALILFKDIYNEKEDNEPLFLNAIAICEYSIYRYKEALISINKALEYINEPQLKLTKASILTELGNERKDDKLLLAAKEIFEEILPSFSNATLLYNYGNCLSNLKKYKEAKFAFEESLKLDPNNERVWNSLGNIYNELTFPQFALNCFDNALTINPELTQAIFNKGQTVFRKFGKAEIGLKIMLESIELDRGKIFELEFPYTYFWIAEAYLNLGDIRNALKMNTKGYNLYPGDNHFINQKDRIKKGIPLV